MKTNKRLRPVVLELLLVYSLEIKVISIFNFYRKTKPHANCKERINFS